VKLDKNRATLLVLSLLPLILGSVIAVAVLGSSLIGQLIAHSPSFTAEEVAVQAAISTVLGMAVVLVLFWIMERGGRRGQRLVVALVVSPILGFVSLFTGESLLLVMFKGSTNILVVLVLVVSLGVTLLSIVLVVSDLFPPVMRSAFAGFYGSVFGTFLGITMVTASMAVIVISIAVEDYLLTRYSPAASPEQMSESVGSDPFDYARIKSSRVAVGAGDYITYSLIAAHSVVFFPFHVWAMTFVLLVFGILINVTVLVHEEAILPAIPLPALMALFPWFVHIAALALLPHL
jgi:hypothetical protein